MSRILFRTSQALHPTLRRASRPFQSQLLKPLTIVPRAAMSSNPAKHDTSQLKASSLFDTTGLVAIVTGGGTGIGLMISQALVANGAKVYITGRRKEVLETTVKEHGDGGEGAGSMHALPGDVSDPEDVKRLASEIESKEPNGIHLLINNAGIARDQNTQFSKAGKPDFTSADSISSHFLQTPIQTWHDTMHTNVAAAYYTSMTFLPLLAKAKSSPPSTIPDYSPQIINVSSISGAMKGSSGGQFAYAASKAAYTHLSRMLATTFSELQVRVNIIAPGVFPSEMTADESGQDNKSKLDDEQASNPSGRFGRDSDMAGTVLFLAGKGGSWYNEQTLFPDGGSTLSQPAAK